MTTLSLPDPPLRDRDVGIVLRPWGRPGDARALASAWADPEIVGVAIPLGDRSEPAARRWIAGDAERRRRGVALDLVIECEGTGRYTQLPNAEHATGAHGVLGEVGLAHFDEQRRAEIGFWLTEAARGRGIARAAVATLSNWVLDPDGLARRVVFARVAPGNDSAAWVLERGGYTRMGAASGYDIWARQST